MKDKIILKDGTAIEIEAGASLSAITVLVSTKEEMMEKWDKLTRENLSIVEVKNSDDIVIAKYENLILASETSTILEDGTISTVFHLREKTQAEIDIDELKQDIVEQEKEMMDMLLALPEEIQAAIIENDINNLLTESEV